MSIISRGSGKVVVVGLGITGLSVVNFLLGKGYQVAVTDSRTNPPNAEELPADVQTVFGDIDAELLLSASFIVISPGLSRELPPIKAAIDVGIEVVGDIHLCAADCHIKNIPIVAITGSNAKSTVTTLVGEMALASGIKAGIGGNLGKPALDLLSDNPDMLILELSSFQLESTSDLGAKVACVLNMSADHLDRHGDMLGYHTTKHRIFQGAQSIVVNREDNLTKPLVADNLPRLSFGAHAPDLEQYGLHTVTENGLLKTYLAKGSTNLLAADELLIKGEHNLLNALAALAIAELAGFEQAACLQVLKTFKGLPHRCAFVASVAGVDYFNDSKGTNVGSTLAAINGLGQSYQQAGDARKLHVILGGEGKDQDFSPLADAISKYAKAVYLIGRDAELIKTAIAKKLIQYKDNTVIEFMDSGELATAVNQAHASAKVGDVVLLSPACASFDQFKSYVSRGERFIEQVKSLPSPLAEDG